MEDMKTLNILCDHVVHRKPQLSIPGKLFRHYKFVIGALLVIVRERADLTVFFPKREAEVRG